MYSADLLQMPLEDAVNLLTRLPPNTDAGELLRHISGVALTEERFADALVQAHASASSSGGGDGDSSCS